MSIYCITCKQFKFRNSDAINCIAELHDHCNPVPLRSIAGHSDDTDILDLLPIKYKVYLMKNYEGCQELIKIKSCDYNWCVALEDHVGKLQLFPEYMVFLKNIKGE